MNHFRHTGITLGYPFQVIEVDAGINRRYRRRGFAVGNDAFFVVIRILQVLDNFAVEQLIINRFRDVVVHAHGFAFFHIYRGYIGREGNNGHFQMQLGADVFRGLKPIHFGHLQVHQHDVVAGGTQFLHGNPAVAGHFHFEAEILQQRFHQKLVQGNVFHYQNFHVFESGFQLNVQVRFGIGFLQRFVEAQDKTEGGADAHSAFHGNGAALGLYQVLDDGQAQAGAAVQARGATGGLLEVVENSAQLRFFNANASIRDGELQDNLFRVLHQHPHAYGDAALARKLHRVAHQVQNNLMQPHRVAYQHLRNLFIVFHHQLQVLFLNFGFKQMHHGRYRSRELERNLLEGHPTRVHLGQIQNVVDEHNQRIAA